MASIADLIQASWGQSAPKIGINVESSGQRKEREARIGQLEAQERSLLQKLEEERKAMEKARKIQNLYSVATVGGETDYDYIEKYMQGKGWTSELNALRETRSAIREKAAKATEAEANARIKTSEANAVMASQVIKASTINTDGGLVIDDNLLVQNWKQAIKRVGPAAIQSSGIDPLIDDPGEIKNSLRLLRDYSLLEKHELDVALAQAKRGPKIGDKREVKVGDNIVTYFYQPDDPNAVKEGEHAGWVKSAEAPRSKMVTEPEHKMYLNRRSELSTELSGSSDTLQSVKELQLVLETTDLSTGLGQDALRQLRKIGDFVNYPIDESKLKDADTIRATVKGLTLSVLSEKVKGAGSNLDLMTVEQSLPALTTGKAANEFLLKSLESGAVRTSMVAQLYTKGYKGPKTYDEAFALETKIRSTPFIGHANGKPFFFQDYYNIVKNRATLSELLDDWNKNYAK